MADPRQIVGLTGENREAHKASTTATGPADHITSGASDATAANPSRAGCLPVCLDDRSVNEHPFETEPVGQGVENASGNPGQHPAEPLEDASHLSKRPAGHATAIFCGTRTGTASRKRRLFAVPAAIRAGHGIETQHVCQRTHAERI